MSFIIGTRRFGKIKSFANQYIDTKFLVIGFPIFPLESYFVDKETKTEIQIKLSGKSILSCYLLFLTFIGIWSEFILFVFISDYVQEKYIIPIFILVTLFVLAQIIYTIFYFGSATKNEKKMRACIQNVLIFNALPKYLTQKQIESNYNKLIENIEPNWESNIEIRKFSGDNFFKYYTTLLFKFELKKDEKTQRLIHFMEESYIDKK